MENKIQTAKGELEKDTADYDNMRRYEAVEEEMEQIDESIESYKSRRMRHSLLNRIWSIRSLC